MRNKTRGCLCVVIAALMIDVAGVSALAGFNGHSIQMTEYQGNAPNQPVGGVTDFGTRVVGPGPEPYSLTGWTVDISDDTIRMDNNSFDFSFGTSFPFFGDAFFDVFSQVEPIVNATLVTTNISGFNASRLTFDSDHVYFNFANLPMPVGVFVEARVQFVPEPGAIAVAAMPLVALSRSRRRRPSARA
jgi:hypothetical protein